MEMADSSSTTIYSIAEFILRQQTISDGLANALLLALPFPSAASSSSCSAPPSLRRAILLRSLSSDVSKRHFSPRTLRLIELLQVLNPRSNPLASDAYLSVATYIVTSAPCFVSAVSSVFVRRIGDILTSPDASGLASDRMKAVAEEMEKALTDHDLRLEIVGRNTLNEALETVRVFLEQEKEDMALQPCFLETAAPIATQRKSSSFSKSILTPKVKKVMEELQSNCAVLLENIEDPLPEAIKFANEVAESLHGKVGEEKTDIQADMGVPENCKRKDGSTSGEGTSAGARKQSLMDHQSTAFHYEWSETPELSSDNSDGVSRRKFHLATPKRIPVSPLRQVPKRQVGVKRRRVKKWTSLEEETLRKAVEEFGRGNWKKMLDHYCYIFEERTEVDLKDKWRNMTRG